MGRTNEFEHRTPHRTTDYGSGAAPWLVSMAMWIKYLRFVPDTGITARELGRVAGLSKTVALERLVGEGPDGG